MAAPDTNYLSPPAFAKRAGISVRSLYGYLQTGKVAGVKNQLSGRVMIPESELQKVFQPFSGEEAPPVPAPATKRAVTTPPTTPAIDPVLAVKDAILESIASRHGQDGAEKVSAGWTEGVNETIAFILKMPGGINLENVRKVTALLPAETLNYPPATWVVPIIAAANQSVPPVAIVPKEPDTYQGQPFESDEELLDPEGPEIRAALPAPEPARRPTAKPKAPRLPKGDSEVCATCNVKKGHASGCPTGIREELAKRGPEASPRVQSPKADAANAAAYLARARRERDGGDMASLPDGFEFCTDKGCAFPYHRYVQLPGKSGWFIGHMPQDKERAAEVEARETMKKMGATPAGIQTPDDEPPTVKRKRPPKKRKKP